MLLKVSQVQAALLPGADGFRLTYRCRNRQTYSREATGLSTRLEQSPNNQNRPRKTDNISQYIPEFDSTIDNEQIQRKYKHAGSFVTTCQLTEKEETELKTTHNFGGGEGWFSGQVKNLPPQ